MLASFFELTAWLYYLCFLLVAALLLGIALGSHHKRRNTPLRRLFEALALCLLLWQLTLFAEGRIANLTTQLWLGRLNFSAMALAPYFALRFVQAIARSRTLNRENRWIVWCRVETALLAAVTLLSPWIDAAERVQNRQAISTYGPLFPLYIAHVSGYWMAALIVALRERRLATKPMVRDQLKLIGGGMLMTGGVALITNVILPYGFGDFRWCDSGALSTLLFLLAIAYATLRRQLFDLRVLVRETLVYGLLLAFVLGGYSSAVFVVSQYLTEGAGKGMQFAVLFIAFSFDPLRRWLEKETDRLLFEARDGDEGKGPSSRRQSNNRRTLGLVFPWWRL